MNLQRKLSIEIEKSIKNIAVTAILGARQVGKTTLAKEIVAKYENAIYLDLEKDSDYQLLNNAEQFLNLNKNVSLFCIDEVQLKPNLFKTLRSFVDENKAVRFLLLGSASIELLQQTSETLAGRIFYYELNPFNFNEIKEIKSINDYHLLGGFPKSILATDNDFSFLWLQNFIKTFLERDLQLFGFTIPPLVVKRLWIMLAHLNGQVLNYSSLARSMGIDEKTVKKYVFLLHNTYMLNLLQPYFVNIKKRLIKSPKIYIKDTGVLHSLLNIKTYNDLYANPIFGSSWETLVIENVIRKHSDWEHFYYRTSAGSEIDLVLVKGLKVIAIEIKASITPKLKKGFWTAIEDIKATNSFIIAPVKHTYLYKNNVFVYNLEEFLNLEL